MHTINRKFVELLKRQNIGLSLSSRRDRHRTTNHPPQYVLPLRHADPAQTPWTSLDKPLADCTVTLVSSAGIHLKGDQPFDLERERRQPTWGDPSHREIPKTAGQDDVEYTHLHVQTSYLRQDRNVAWPVDIFLAYEREGRIGRLAVTCKILW